MNESFGYNPERPENRPSVKDVLSEVPENLKKQFAGFFEDLDGLMQTDEAVVAKNRDLIVNTVIGQQFSSDQYPELLKDLMAKLESEALTEKLAAEFNLPLDEASNLASMRLSPEMTKTVAVVLNKVREWCGGNLGAISEDVAGELSYDPERLILDAQVEFAQSVLVNATLAGINAQNFLSGSLPGYKELRDYAVDKGLNCSGAAKFRLLEMARDLDTHHGNTADPAGEYAFLNQIRDEAFDLKDDPVLHEQEGGLIDSFLERVVVKMTARAQEFALARGVGIEQVFSDQGVLNLERRGDSVASLVGKFGPSIEEVAIADVSTDYLGPKLRELPRDFATALMPWETAVSGMRVATNFAKFLRNRPDPRDADFRQAQNVTFGALDRLAEATQGSAEAISKLIDDLRERLAELSNPESGPEKIIALRLKRSISELSALVMNPDSPFSEKGVGEIADMRDKMRKAIAEHDIANLKRCVGYAVLILGATGGAVLAGRLIARVATGLFGETVATTGGLALSNIGKLGVTTPNVVRFATWGTSVLGMSAGGVLGYEATAHGLNGLYGREEFLTAKNAGDLFDRWGQGVLMMGGVSAAASGLGKAFYGMSNIQHPSLAAGLVRGLGRVGDYGMTKVNTLFSPTKWSQAGQKHTTQGFFRQWGEEALEEGMESLGQAMNQYVGLAGSIANARRGGRLNIGRSNVDLGKVGITVNEDGGLTYIGQASELATNLRQKFNLGDDVDVKIEEGGRVIIDCAGSGGAKFFVEPAMKGLDFDTALERAGLKPDENGECTVDSIQQLSDLSEALGQNGFVFSRDASGVIRARHANTGTEITINVDSTLMLTLTQAVGKLRDATNQLAHALDEFTANPTDAIASKVQTAMATLLLLVTGCSDATVDPNSKIQDDAIRTIFSKIGGDNWFGDALGWIGSFGDDLDFLGLIPAGLMVASRLVHLPRLGITGWPKSAWKNLTNRPDLRNRIAALQKALKVRLDDADTRVGPRGLIVSKLDEIFAISDTEGGFKGIRAGWRIKEIIGRPFVDSNNGVAKKIDSSLKKIRGLLKKAEELTGEELTTLNQEVRKITDVLDEIPNLPLKTKKEIGALRLILASIAMLPWLLNFGYNRIKTKTKIIENPGSTLRPRGEENSNMKKIAEEIGVEKEGDAEAEGEAGDDADSAENLPMF